MDNVLNVLLLEHWKNIESYEKALWRNSMWHLAVLLKHTFA